MAYIVSTSDSKYSVTANEGYYTVNTPTSTYKIEATQGHYVVTSSSAKYSVTVTSGNEPYYISVIEDFKERVEEDGGIFESEEILIEMLEAFKKCYDKASLILTPNAYKEGKIYSLKGDDFSYTRAGAVKTRIIEDGTIEAVPYNILNHSQEFNVPTTGWAFSNTTFTSTAELAPDGTNTAYLITNTGNAVLRTISYVVSPNTTYTASWYAKRGTVDTLVYRLSDLANGVTLVNTSYADQL